jgi:hypothetical protein
MHGLLFRRSFLAGLALLVTAGCGHNIGDACTSNVDCSPAGDRFCDLSVISGYCTVEGCDINTCPNNEPCVRFFTVIVTEPCDYDSAEPGHCKPGTRCCQPDERCVPDLAATGGVVPGHCAPESTERRWCMHGCGSDGDCRDQNFLCRSTSPAPPGSRIPILPGALPVPSIADPAGVSNASSFCIQRD